MLLHCLLYATNGSVLADNLHRTNKQTWEKLQRQDTACINVDGLWNFYACNRYFSYALLQVKILLNCYVNCGSFKLSIYRNFKFAINVSGEGHANEPIIPQIGQEIICKNSAAWFICVFTILLVVILLNIKCQYILKMLFSGKQVKN